MKNFQIIKRIVFLTLLSLPFLWLESSALSMFIIYTSTDKNSEIVGYFIKVMK